MGSKLGSDAHGKMYIFCNKPWSWWGGQMRGRAEINVQLAL